MIVPLHAGNPGAMTGAGNWTYFLPGAHPALIDAGVGQESHLQAIARARPEGPGHVLVTHAHVDHISGAAAIAARWPDARFSKKAWPERDERYDVAWQALRDGDRVPAGDGELEVIGTPGHAPDHVAFWHAPTRTLFSGDLVVAGSTVVIPASGGGRLTDYLESLERVLALHPARLLPAHGPAIDDPARLILEYLEHRRERERQICSALMEGLHTIDAMVARIYPEVPSVLVGMARESVLAHLIKLRDEGRVRSDGDHWALTAG